MAWQQIAAAGVQAASGLFGSIIAGEYNKKLAQQQNEFNLEMWNRENEYNSPQAQMQRFEEAGLNPNLIYGQGSAGNASAPPVQVAPKAPDIEGAAKKIGEAFNVENLAILDAKRREAQADAKTAEVNANRESDHYEADKAIGQQYDYDEKTGQFVKMQQTPDNVTVYRDPGVRYYKLQHLADNFTKNFLLTHRRDLLERQSKYIDPQIRMAEYDAEYYPYSYWIGQGTKIANSIAGFIPKLKLGGARGTYTAPGGRQYYY